MRSFNFKSLIGISALGLALIAGDQTATTPQPGEATGWTCGSRSTLSDVPPTCPASAPLHLVLTFQDCWDGQYLDSEDHASHAAYSEAGECPASHPVHPRPGDPSGRGRRSAGPLG